MGRVLQRLDFRAYDKTRKPPKAMCERDVVHPMDALEKKNAKAVHVPATAIVTLCILYTCQARRPHGFLPADKRKKNTAHAVRRAQSRVLCHRVDIFVHIFLIVLYSFLCLTSRMAKAPSLTVRLLSRFRP